MKNFLEPRLRNYLALDITYNISMSYASLLSAIQCIKEYKEKKYNKKLDILKTKRSFKTCKSSNGKIIQNE